MKSEFPDAEKLKFKPLFRISGFVICHEKSPALPEDSRSSTISGRVRVAVLKGKPIPLTLTLSHRAEGTAGGRFGCSRGASGRHHAGLCW